MKLHLIAVPEDCPRVDAQSFCGRIYKGQGPQQPQNSSRVKTTCGEEVFFRHSLAAVMQEQPCDSSVCTYCIHAIEALPKKAKRRVLAVVRKSLDDKLEKWEAEALTAEELKRRVYARIFREPLFRINDMAHSMGLKREQIEPHVATLVEKGVIELTTRPDGQCYYRTESEAFRSFVDEAFGYTREDMEKDDVDEVGRMSERTIANAFGKPRRIKRRK